MTEIFIVIYFQVNSLFVTADTTMRRNYDYLCDYWKPIEIREAYKVDLKNNKVEAIPFKTCKQLKEDWK